MAAMLIQQPIRNDFSFIGVKELSENPDYIKVYDFEKHDYVRTYLWINNNLYATYSVAIVYLVGIFALQRWMKNREAFDLRKPLFFWNVFLAGISMIMFYRILPELVYLNKKNGFYSTYCKKDHFNAATVFWLHVYTASKVLEFVDTTFIVLRKQRLTFLHTFHHTSVYIACIFGIIRFDPSARYFALMNCFVHSVMYTYFALKSIQVKLPRKLAMAVTGVQLIQFITALGINLLVFYAKVMGTEPRCERPDDISVYYSILGLVYLYLFGNFFVQSYLKKKTAAKLKSQ